MKEFNEAPTATQQPPIIVSGARVVDSARLLYVSTVLFFLMALGYLIPRPELDVAFPAVLTITCLATAYATIKNDHVMIWAPLPWFLVTCALYYGIGALVYPLGSEQLLRYLDTFFPLDPYWLRRTNLLNAVAMLVICATYLLVSPRTRVLAQREPTPADLERLNRMAWFCLVVAYVARLVIRGGDPTGVGSGGTIKSLENLTQVALVLFAFLIIRGQRRLLWVFLPALFVELYVAFSFLMRNNLLIICLSVFLGLYWARPSRKLMVSSVLVGVVLFTLLSPIVQFGRDVRWNLNSTISNSDIIAGSLRILTTPEYRDNPRNQLQWARMSYANAQAFAMSQYDRGAPGNTLSLALYTIVPRVLWQGKPSITPGAEFNYLALGNAQSASAPGVFAESYWNGGWSMVLATSAYIGLLFAISASFVVRRLRGFDPRWLPAATIVIGIGYRPDSWFVASYIGFLPIAIALTATAYLFVGSASPLQTAGRDSANISLAGASR